jgi:hypothetical protein
VASRQAIVAGFPFPLYINETGTRQAIAAGPVYVNETVSTAPPPSSPPQNPGKMMVLHFPGVGSR